MKIVSWNCHYGLTEKRFEHLMQAEDGKFAGADVYAFQEVLENEFISIPDYANAQSYKYRHWYGDHFEYGDCHIPRGSEGDLGMVLMSNNYKIERLDQGLIPYRYIVPYLLSNSEESFYLLHVWTKGKPDGYIEAIYKTLDFYKTKLNDNIPVVMIGDFNFGVEFDDDFFRIFKKEITNRIPNFNQLSLEGNNKQSFYYPRYSDRKYFNDAIYVKKCSGSFSIGKTNEWIQALGAESDYSDHCPIVGNIDFN